MNSTALTPEKEERLDQLLLMIGGLEVAIRDQMEARDHDFVKVLKAKRANYYERLRRVAYGLPERDVPTTPES
jgi:hypothetical protein